MGGSLEVYTRVVLFLVDEGLTPCQKAQKDTNVLPFRGSYVVRCKQNGMYEEVQCSGSTGFCWCVDKHGVEMKGTKTRGPLKCPVSGGLEL